MKNLLFSMAILCSTAMSEVPEVVITHAAMSAKGYITVAGHLKTIPSEPVGVQVRNGGITYATVTDPQGKWGILVASYSGNVDAKAFDLKNRLDQSPEIHVRVTK